MKLIKTDERHYKVARPKNWDVAPAVRKRLSKYAPGSNQHVKRDKTKRQNTFLLIGFWGVFLIAVSGVLAYKSFSPEYAYAQKAVEEVEFSIISPYVPPVELQPLTLEQEQDWEAMKRMAHKLAPLYDYPAQVIIAQMALESARGTSKHCIERNNCFGIGAYDHDPDQAFRFENKEQAIIEYMRLIKNHYPDAYAHRSDPHKMIELIKAGGYATDPNYVTKVQWIMEQEK